MYRTISHLIRRTRGLVCGLIWSFTVKLLRIYPLCPVGAVARDKICAEVLVLVAIRLQLQVMTEVTAICE